MAEFCLCCWNKINCTNDSPRKYILSKEPDLREECGCMTQVIVMERKYYYLRKFRWILLPLKCIVTLLLVVVAWPYILYQYKRKKRENLSQ